MKLTSIQANIPAGANGLSASESPQQGDIDFLSILMSLGGVKATLPDRIGPLQDGNRSVEESGEDDAGEEADDALIPFRTGDMPGLAPYAAAGTIAFAAAMSAQEGSSGQADASEVHVLREAYSTGTYEAGMGSYFDLSGRSMTVAAGLQGNRTDMTGTAFGAGIQEIGTAYAEAARAAGAAIPDFGTGQYSLSTVIPASDIGGEGTLPVQEEQVLQHGTESILNSAAAAAQSKIEPQGGSPVGSIRTAAGSVTESYQARRTIGPSDEKSIAIDRMGIEVEAGAFTEAKDSFPDTVKALYESSVSQARRAIRSDDEQKKPSVGDDSGIAGTATAQPGHGTRELSFFETADPGKGEEAEALLTGSLSQVTQGITDKLGSGESEFVIKLKPEGLGEIMVKMAKRDGKIVLSLAVSNPQTERLLSGEIENLRQSLRVHEAEIDRITGPLPESGTNGYAASHGAFSYAEDSSGLWRFQDERRREDTRGHAYTAMIDDSSGIEAESVPRLGRTLLDKYA